MLDWKPIEEYDSLKKKPNNCLFRFAPSSGSKRNHLKELFDTNRIRGNRVCTHYAEFDSPVEAEEES